MKLTFAKFVAFIVMIAAYVVMIGWFFDIEMLQSIMPQWGSMRFTTAISFFFAGIVVFAVAANADTEGFSPIAEMFLPTSVLVILLIMVTLLASVFLGVRTGIEDIFVGQSPQEILKPKSGQASLGDILGFLLLAFVGMNSMVRSAKQKRRLQLVSTLMILVSGAALLGYIVGNPLLYLDLEGVSTGMAAHTASLFLIIGLAFFGLSFHEIRVKRVRGKDEDKDKDQDEEVEVEVEQDSKTEESTQEPKQSESLSIDFDSPSA